LRAGQSKRRPSNPDRAAIPAAVDGNPMMIARSRSWPARMVWKPSKHWRQSCGRQRPQPPLDRPQRRRFSIEGSDVLGRRRRSIQRRESRYRRPLARRPGSGSSRRAPAPFIEGFYNPCRRHSSLGYRRRAPELLPQPGFSAAREVGGPLHPEPDIAPQRSFLKPHAYILHSQDQDPEVAAAAFPSRKP
jgi:hypothetical protein